MRMYEVFYDGASLGQIASTVEEVAGKAKEFVENCLSGCGKTKAVYDPAKITYSDKNHDKYKHFMNRR